MNILKDKQILNRRDFLNWVGSGLAFSALRPFRSIQQTKSPAGSDLFWIKEIPRHPFVGKLGVNAHAGMDTLLHVMGMKGLKFYRSSMPSELSGPSGLISADDVVLLKVRTVSSSCCRNSTTGSAGIPVVRPTT